MNFLRWVLLLLLVGVIFFTVLQLLAQCTSPPTDAQVNSTPWLAPDTSDLPMTPEGNLIRYGRELIANTSYYLGPRGTVASISNAMNCQNCHIAAGARLYGNSFSGVASIYPVFKPRSGKMESIEFRINDCFRRSMNGRVLDTASPEMRAMVAYLLWIGKDVPKGTKPPGTGITDLPYLDRAADTLRGRIVYASKCQSCHGLQGHGVMNEANTGFVYPPLWGPGSYNIGAGLYRIGRFAGYVKYTMPLGATHEKPTLTNEEAWDVAAFVNSRQRPEKLFPEDWPDIKKKSIDYPFGPYGDNFSEAQHKYGPFGPIKLVRDSTNSN